MGKASNQINSENENAIKWAAVRCSSGKNAALAINEIYKEGHSIDLKSLKDELIRQADTVVDGDIKGLERMLVAQAQTLDSLFYHAAERISNCHTKEQRNSYVELSIKASNACRKTIATLHQLKNPSRAIFVREQNNLLAQQINNHLNIAKNLNSENELLKGDFYEALDSRRAFTSVAIDSSVEALEVGRSKNS